LDIEDMFLYVSRPDQRSGKNSFRKSLRTLFSFQVTSATKCPKKKCKEIYPTAIPGIQKPQKSTEEPVDLPNYFREMLKDELGTKLWHCHNNSRGSKARRLGGLAVWRLGALLGDSCGEGFKTVPKTSSPYETLFGEGAPSLHCLGSATGCPFLVFAFAFVTK
jgi:hypothetical protein